jgi:uncharacterized UPF0160 family protein
MHTVVTHNGSFDPDDVLAVATLQLQFGKESLQIIRSRDEMVIAAADFVVDVGGVYDPDHKRFDHHQNGVPKRDNGIPYAAFGLVWLEYGVELAGSVEAAAQVERKIVLPIDAADNHITVCHPGQAGVGAFEFFDMVDALKPVWDSEESFDEQFLIAVDFARELLVRLIAHTNADLELQAYVRSVYESGSAQSVLVFDKPVGRHALVEYEVVRVVVVPKQATGSTHWDVLVVPTKERGFQNRVLFPEAWAGLSSDELEVVSKIEGAVFCHKERYIFVAETKEAALKAARHAH